MMYVQQSKTSRTLLVILGACILLALACIPASADAGSSIRPSDIRITSDDSAKNLMRLAYSEDTSSIKAPDLLWKFAVFWDGDFHGRTAIPAVGGGYLIAGESREGGTEESAEGAAIVLEEPINGETTWRWAWLYGTDGVYDTFSDAVADTDGYVFVGGSRAFNPPQTDGWLLHTAADGYDGTPGAYWQRSWPGAESQYADQFNAVVRTSDGDFASTGITRSYHPNTTTSDAWLIRTDNTGTTTGSGAYDGTVPKSAESIRETSDGGFILAGESTPADGTATKLLLVRLNSDNSIAWQQEFGSNPENRAYDVRQTSDGGFIAAGETVDASGHRSMYLVRTDGNGNLLFESTPASSRPSADARGVVETDDGGFMVAGTSQGALVVRLDAAGQVLWENVYVPEYPDSTVASIERTSDGGFVISGTRIQADEPNPGFSIIRLGPEKAVQQPVALPGMTGPPTDPDNDGLYEDLNANGRADFADVTLFFEQMEWIAANQPVALFDFNGNQRIDFADISALFTEI